MRRLNLAVAALLGAVLISCAADERGKPKEEPGGGKSRADRLREIQDAYRENEQKLVKELQAATTPEGQRKIFFQFRESTQPFARKALEIAREDPKDETAFEALKFAATATPGEETRAGREATDLLLEHHLDRPETAHFLSHVAEPSGAGVERLREIARKSKSREVRGTAFYLAAEGLIQQAEAPFLKDRKKQEELTKEAEELFAKVSAEYGDVSSGPGTLGKQAERYLFQIRNLSIGRAAPELEMETLGGKKEKLSDYRGKVVVLDVWATWCAPCVAMIPHERKLVERLRGKPFALISVSIDDSREAVEKFLEAEPMPWVHWFNGAKGGIVEKWNVVSIPAVYVLDPKGVIRYKGVRGEEMDAAVDELLKEAEKKEE